MYRLVWCFNFQMSQLAPPLQGGFQFSYLWVWMAVVEVTYKAMTQTGGIFETLQRTSMTLSTFVEQRKCFRLFGLVITVGFLY